MNPDLALSLGCQVFLAISLVGLVSSGRWRSSILFTAYVVATLTGNMLRVYWPATFYVPAFWMMKEGVYDVLCVGLALEIGWRTFAPFRGALHAARILVALGLSATVGVVALAALNPLPAASDAWYLQFAAVIHPRVGLATLFLMGGLLAAATWYRVPMHPFHVSTIAALGSYLSVNAGLSALEAVHGWSAQPYFNALDRIAYLALAARFAWLAWGPESRRVGAYQDVLARVS